MWVETVRRLIVSLVIVLSLILTAVPLVSAQCETESLGCRRTIKVIPVGSVETGEPIVTTTPANLMIFHTGQGPIQNVWLLIVLNKPTYDALSQITINGSTFMTKADFKLATTKKIPPTSPNSTTGYPGSLCHYEVSAVRDKLEEKNDPIYYGMKYFLARITTAHTDFTLAVELTSAADLKALILAMGRYDPCHSTANVGIECVRYEPFNACSSFSKSTLVVPEPATLVMTAVPLVGIAGLYAVKRRKK